MPIKSFRGKLADDAIEAIFLHTNTGSTGYRIKKFQIMPGNPTNDNMEATVKIYKIPQTAASNTIDFEDLHLPRKQITKDRFPAVGTFVFE